LQVDAEKKAADQTDGDDGSVEQGRDDRRSDHPGNHQPVDRIDAEYLHRVDLFADGARTQIGANGRGSGAGHHQHGGQRPQLGDRTQGGACTRDVSGAKGGQQGVEREDDQYGQRYRDGDRG
jgi:hypothetical protein